MTQSELLADYAAALMPTFGTPQRVLVAGRGCQVTDADGNTYLDLLGGIAVNALGHANPEVNQAICTQLGTLDHVSNFFATGPQIALAQKLDAMVGGDARVFFTNSGTEANEAAFKLARRTERPRIIAMTGAFHGRTMGALALTATEKYRAPFEPLPGGVEFAPYGDLAALAAMVDDSVAAIVVEPIQGEAGVIDPGAEFLAGVREIADRHGALLWFDEVQTGMGRCGSWLASEGIEADVITLAKALGNGFPMGACIARGWAATLLGPGSHGSTFGGNPVAAAAALKVIEVMERDGLLSHATAMGEHLQRAVLALDEPLISGVRGRGLLQAIVLAEPIAPAIAAAALEAGFIVNAPRPDVIRVAPPLIITAAELDSFAAALPQIVAAAKGA